MAVAACRRTSARPRASLSSPPTRETRSRRPISGSSTRRAVAACRRTTARPRASTSSPPIRETRRAGQSRGFYGDGRGGLPKDEREAARLFKLAADQGNADGQCQSRGLLRGWPWRPAEGRGRGRAPLQARRRPGKRDAQANLGVFYETGRGGLPKDEREAARLYKLAADQGNAGAQANLGVFYEDGRGGLPKDEREAARLYKLAADQGNADATVQSRGLLRGWPRRPAEGRARGRAPLQARRRPGKRRRAGQSRGLLRGWPRRPAEGRARGRAPLTSSPPTRETPTAQYNLGVFYENGRGGLPKDEREAARLFKLPPTREMPPRKPLLLGSLIDAGAMR